MSLQVRGYQFAGPYPLQATWQLQNASGVYLILTQNGGPYTVIDVGESADVRTRVTNHDREDSWRRNETNGLYVAVLYCDQWQTMQIEQELRRSFRPVCGVR